MQVFVKTNIFCTRTEQQTILTPFNES